MILSIRLSENVGITFRMCQWFARAYKISLVLKLIGVRNYHRPLHQNAQDMDTTLVGNVWDCDCVWQLPQSLDPQ